MGVKIPANAGYFRLLDKQCIKAFNSLPENSRFIGDFLHGLALALMR